MTRPLLFSAVLVAALSIAAQLLLPPRAHAADPVGQGGVHPWEERGTTLRRDRVRPVSYRLLLQYENSRYRTRSFALHPYYRGRYYGATRYDALRYGDRSLGAEPWENPAVISCSNYTYERPVRGAPMRFSCE